MRKFLLMIILLLSLCSCDSSSLSNDETHFTPEPTFDRFITAAPITPSPEPLHSEFYISELPVEDVIRYFNEVSLDAEFVNGGDPRKIQKWNSPIYYYIFGDPTEADLLKLDDLCDWLNGISGFPGFFPTESQYDANLKIYFCDYDTMIQILGDQFYGNDAGVTFWYDNNVIYDAKICIRTDLSQELRNSVILEEVYNGLGPIQDTVLRPDSVIYSDFSQPQELSQIDELLMELLYHPDIKCGMNAAECEAVIYKLYY